MRLRKGDKIYCVVNNVSDLTKNKCYEVININVNFLTKTSDICIKDDKGYNWWFGQAGETEPWTMWFISEKEWLRDIKLKKLGI